MPFHVVQYISLQMLASKTIVIKASDGLLNKFNQLESDQAIWNDMKNYPD